MMMMIQLKGKVTLIAIILRKIDKQDQKIRLTTYRHFLLLM